MQEVCLLKFTIDLIRQLVRRQRRRLPAAGICNTCDAALSAFSRVPYPGRRVFHATGFRLLQLLVAPHEFEKAEAVAHRMNAADFIG
jgi:hypothetical protein